MTTTPEAWPWQTQPARAALDWATAAIGPGARVRSVRRLGRGIAQATHALTIDDRTGRRHRLVLQRWIRPGWRAEDPGFDPAKEASVLLALAATSIPAPRLIAVDVDGAAAGDPALLVERLPGRPPTDLAVRGPVVLGALGETLAAIHQAGAPGGPLAAVADALPRYFPFGELAGERPPAASRRPALWRRALAAAAATTPAGPHTLIHRDFHAGNTLWLGGRLTGVVDWTSASWGMPAADLAHLRVDLVSRAGPDQADAVRVAFARAGGDLTDARHHDLRTVFDYLTGRTLELSGSELDRFEQFLDRVL